MYSYLFGTGERSLFGEFDRLQREIDSLFNGGARASIRGVSSFPAVDVGATPEEVHVYLFAPGLSAKDFDVNIQQNVLTIAGKRAAPEASKDATWFVRERFDGEF